MREGNSGRQRPRIPLDLIEKWCVRRANTRPLPLPNFRNVPGSCLDGLDRLARGLGCGHRGIDLSGVGADS